MRKKRAEAAAQWITAHHWRVWLRLQQYGRFLLLIRR
jgi:hypothetical protein